MVRKSTACYTYYWRQQELIDVSREFIEVSKLMVAKRNRFREKLERMPDYRCQIFYKISKKILNL